MRKLILSLLALMMLAACSATENEKMPALFKILTQEQWLESQGKPQLSLGAFDEAFIHLCEEEQIERIAAKFFADEPAIILLHLDRGRLVGRLVKERNPGGSTEYYHLYDGQIPLDAVLSAETRQQN